MSHHIKGPQGTHFNFNSDLSGDVQMNRGDAAFLVPGDDLKRFMAQWIMDQRISKLEDMSDNELLIGGAP